MIRPTTRRKGPQSWPTASYGLSDQGGLNTKDTGQSKILLTQRSKDAAMSESVACLPWPRVPSDSWHNVLDCTYPNSAAGKDLFPCLKCPGALASCHMRHTYMQYKVAHPIPRMEERLLLARKKNLGPSSSSEHSFYTGGCSTPRALYSHTVEYDLSKKKMTY